MAWGGAGGGDEAAGFDGSVLPGGQAMVLNLLPSPAYRVVVRRVKGAVVEPVDWYTYVAFGP